MISGHKKVRIVLKLRITISSILQQVSLSEEKMIVNQIKRKDELEDNSKLVASAPWFIYYHQISSMFAPDPEINVTFDEDSLEISLYVDNQSKASAISQILPEYKEFGKVKVRINVIPPDVNWKYEIIKKAFKGNPIVSDIQIIDMDELSNPMCFVIFKKEVVQYYSDNLGDYHGLTSTLYQDIAKEIIPEDGVYYCTDNAV